MEFISIEITTNNNIGLTTVSLTCKTVKTKLLKFGSVVPELTNKEGKNNPNEKAASKITTEQDEIYDHYQKVVKEN